jgi:hypothetical protein
VQLKTFDPKDLKASENYLLMMLSSEVINDAEDPWREDYMRFAGILAGHLLGSGGGDKEVTHLWKKILKAVLKSEKRFNYQIYKGHLLTEIALHSLVSECDIDNAVRILKQSCEEDRLHGYKNLEHRPAYKILSFIQPILTFRSELWPSRRELRHAIAIRMSIVLPLNRSVTGIGWGPEASQRSIADCLPRNEPLLRILTDNAKELEEVSTLADNKGIFYKSTMFLIANIVEGILLDLATRSLSLAQPRKTVVKFFHRLRKKSVPGFERDSIKQLAGKLREKNVIDE